MDKLKQYAASINKAIGAIVGGGLVTVLVGLHVIPASVGNTILALLAAAVAVLGAFLAPANAPVPVDIPDDLDTGTGQLEPDRPSPHADHVPEHAADES